MSLLLVGTSYQRAPVELRELLAYDPGLRREALGRLGSTGSEAAVLATCNRTEVYGVSAEPAELEERIYGELADLSGLSHSELSPALYSVSDEAAALHLFRVAAGLDSTCPGKRRSSARCGRPTRPPARPTRRERRSTASSARLCGSGSGSGRRPPSARTPRRSRRPLPSSPNGSSKTSPVAESCSLAPGIPDNRSAANLISRGVGEIVVANRTPERAEALARRFDGRAVGLDVVEAELARADVVVASTGSQALVVTAAQVERAMKARRGRPIFFIDIAVPRDVDPAVIELGGSDLYDIDDLERVVAESVAGRREEAVRAEAIVSEEADAFRAWQLSLDVVPAISSLRARAESIRREELRRAEGRLAPLLPSQRQAVEALTSQIVAEASAPAHRPDERGCRRGRGRPLRGCGPPSLRARGRCWSGSEAAAVGSRLPRPSSLPTGFAARRPMSTSPSSRSQRPETATDRNRSARSVRAGLRQGDRGGAARRPDRRRRPLRQGHDLQRHRWARRRCLPSPRIPARRALRALMRDPARATGRHGPRPAGAHSYSRSSRASSSSPPRGNVDTRLRKRGERGLDAIVLAAAGLERLGLSSEIGYRFSPEEVLPEAGQGAIGLQVRVGEEHLVRMLDDPGTRERVAAERACVSRIGGGCLAPVAAYHDGQTLTALVADEDGAWLERRSGSDPVKLADELLAATASLRG